VTDDELEEAVLDAACAWADPDPEEDVDELNDALFDAARMLFYARQTKR
jgi:hypothetical protein